MQNSLCRRATLTKLVLTHFDAFDLMIWPLSAVPFITVLKVKNTLSRRRPRAKELLVRGRQMSKNVFAQTFLRENLKRYMKRPPQGSAILFPLPGLGNLRFASQTTGFLQMSRVENPQIFPLEMLFAVFPSGSRVSDF